MSFDYQRLEQAIDLGIYNGANSLVAVLKESDLFRDYLGAALADAIRDGLKDHGATITKAPPDDEHRYVRIENAARDLVFAFDRRNTKNPFNVDAFDDLRKLLTEEEAPAPKPPHIGLPAQLDSIGHRLVDSYFKSGIDGDNETNALMEELRELFYPTESTKENP